MNGFRRKADPSWILFVWCVYVLLLGIDSRRVACCVFFDSSAVCVPDSALIFSPYSIRTFYFLFQFFFGARYRERERKRERREIGELQSTLHVENILLGQMIIKDLWNWFLGVSLLLMLLSLLLLHCADDITAGRSARINWKAEKGREDILLWWISKRKEEKILANPTPLSLSTPIPLFPECG